jgi:flavin reductase (DIM6/NTAB) family NADH-FMN oxidoreductase RutF/rubredoxin
MERIIENSALNQISYGLFILSTWAGGKDNACVVNTVCQLTTNPRVISVAVNRDNYTRDMILKSRVFNVSVLSEEAPFSLFQDFGFRSGRDTDKFAGREDVARSLNGLYYLTRYANAFISARVLSVTELSTHTLFLAEVMEARKLSGVPSATYAYYHAHIKQAPPKPAKSAGKVWVCTVCGYTYDEAKEGVPFEALPEDWVCPLCKHPKSDFVLQE